MVVPVALTGVTHEVTMAGLTFVPDTLDINRGDSVRWINTTAIFHTTTSGVSGVPNGHWDSGLMAPNDSFAFHFDSAGVFPYYCTPHWTLGMVGLITVAPVGIEEFKENLPVEFNVGKAYPNPFNQVVRIDYAIPNAGQLWVGVYSSQGQLVKMLYNANMPGGKHAAFWDGRDTNDDRVGLGAYFVQIEFENNVEQRKVLLLK
jgi:plastocyanin